MFEYTIIITGILFFVYIKNEYAMISKIFFICTNGRFLRKVIVSGRRVIGTQFFDKYLPQRCASISFLVKSQMMN